MHTMRSTVIIVVLFAAAAFTGGYLWRGDVAGPGFSSELTMTVPTSSPTETPAANVTPEIREPKIHTVRFSSTGVLPRTLTVSVGDAVRFVNGTSAVIWPASDPHPTHSGCPELDANRGLRNGESYTLVFDALKTCTYHDHLDPTSAAYRGTITVR